MQKNSNHTLSSLDINFSGNNNNAINKTFIFF